MSRTLPPIASRHISVAFLAVCALILGFAAVADEGRANKWRSQCCGHITFVDEENAICKEVDIKNPCCVTKATECKQGCALEDSPEAKEACEDSCSKDGLACMDKGPVV